MWIVGLAIYVFDSRSSHIGNDFHRGGARCESVMKSKAVDVLKVVSLR